MASHARGAIEDSRRSLRPRPEVRGEETGPDWPGRWSLLRLAVGGYLIVLVVLSALVAVAYRQAVEPQGVLSGPDFLDGWFHMDAGWYWSIAEHGYFYHPGQQSSIAFFPTYPLTVRGVGALIGDYQIAGTVVTVLAALATMVLFARWVSNWLAPAAARMALLLLLLYPFSFFMYGPVYGDSLFMLCVVASFLLLDAGHPWAAALVGIAATAGRPVGIAVTIGLAVRAVELLAIRRRDSVAHTGSDAPGTASQPADPISWRELLRAVPYVRARQCAVLLSVVGLIAWCAYLQIEFGDALAWVHVEAAPGWNQGSGPHTWLKIVFLGTLLKGPLDNVLLLVPQAVACAIALALLPRVRRLFGWGPLAYCVVVLAIPLLGTKDFMGFGRYTLSAFPVLGAAGDFLASRRSRWVQPIAVAACVAGLLIATFFFSRNYEVS
jgi:hypothetical protein